MTIIDTRRILFDGVITNAYLEGDVLVTKDGRQVKEKEATYLPPVIPSKIICVHLNYQSRVDELSFPHIETPTYFLKAPSSLNSHRGKVVRPSACQYLNYEGEIGIVIGRTTKNVSIEEAPNYILGYTVVNDLGLHDFRDTDANSMVRVKGADTLGPIGPGLVEGWDWCGKQLRTYVNGKVVQEDNTDNMIWDVNYLVADLSRLITLEPGDMVFSGTPANSRPVQPGDVVEVEVEGLGRLMNTIVEHDIELDTCGAQPTNSENVRRIALGTGIKK